METVQKSNTYIFRQNKIRSHVSPIRFGLKWYTTGYPRSQLESLRMGGVSYHYKFYKLVPDLYPSLVSRTYGYVLLI